MVNKAKKLILTLAGLFSFSIMAASSDEGVERESIAASVSVAKFSNSLQSPIQKIDAGDIRVSRHKIEKKVRPVVNRVGKSGVKVNRVDQPTKSNRADEFVFFDSWVSLDSDFDGDGYYSEFSLSFDVDTDYSSADVYAEIYLSLEGGTWVLLNTTEDFTIYSNSDTDFYSVSFGLNFDYPTGEYDVLIDLYEVGYSGIVATVEPSDDGDLYRLPLEDNEHELDSNNTLITYVASELFADLDRDGYYTQLTLEYDIDTYDSGRTVYAEVDLTDSKTLQQRTVETQNFQLGNQTEFIDIDFASGYRASYYNIEIKLIDVYTGDVIANAAQDFTSLTQLPIESEEYDYTEVDVHVSGGGSFGFGLVLLTGILFYTRRH